MIIWPEMRSIKKMSQKPQKEQEYTKENLLIEKNYKEEKNFEPKKKFKGIIEKDRIMKGEKKISEGKN